MVRKSVEKLIQDSPLSENYKKLWMEALDYMDSSELELMQDVLQTLPYSDIIEFSKMLDEKVAQYRKQEDEEWEKLVNNNKTN